MAANDLKQPLGQNKKAPVRGSQIFMLGSVGTLAAMVIGLVAWVAIVDDPYGGYARKHIDLTGSLNETARIGVDAIRPGIKPGIPETTRPDQEANAQAPLFPEPNSGKPNDLQDGQIRILDPSAPSLNSVINDDPQAPYKIYSRPINSDAIAGLPKIAMIIDGLGLSQTTTQEALSLLSPDVTLAFAPYGNSLSRWTQKARSQGHELLVQVPMEPFDYPNNDPGPHTLLTTANTDANTANLKWVLARFESYVGVMNYMGARFSSDELAGTDFMRELRKNGLLYVETGASGRSRLNAIATNLSVPNLHADLVVDFRGRASDIETRLIQLEAIAQENGVALGVASALPASVRSISEWTQTLRSRGFALVPVTTLLQQ
ncbi:divergent polysaccharide deacetylase family protein [Cohaesibacter celericrescens]|uniref:Divergent polysaccharide deacetylase family protein n=1 Tax=Cohaesibacter celericrescens TaxID=2067669 RepID=A0A2N5XPE4_9HYPH|nr:divergent polysaccharide deacetylase family protein [Cohaesibacter celericrescens]PLW76411.1 hypothetical protein C0081_16160 [Cohaesibacter celericrescens]